MSKLIDRLKAKRKAVVRKRRSLFRRWRTNRLRKNETRRGILRRFRSRKEQAKRLARRIRRAERRGLPRWLPDRFADHWRRPWTDAAARSVAFRDLIWKHGYASPNFTEAETRCNRGDRVPDHLIVGTQNQAFRLEKCRHDFGGASMPVLSWYRPADYNAAVGGATNSRHIQADASDFDVATVNRIGASRFDRVMNKHYENDGFGQYPAGSRHSDTRGYRARWTSY